jgi:hypothetical protein
MREREDDGRLRGCQEKGLVIKFLFVVGDVSMKFLSDVAQHALC